jgi:hypothetical protein
MSILNVFKYKIRLIIIYKTKFLPHSKHNTCPLQRNNLLVIYKTNCMHKLQTYLKYGLSLLLHVSARLCHHQGVRTPNLKLAGI